MNSDMLLNRIRMAQQGLIGVHKKLYTLEHLLPSPDPAQFAETAKSAALLSERSTASLRGFLFTTTGGMPEGYYQQAAAAQGIKVSATDDYVFIRVPALLPKKKAAEGFKFLVVPLQAAFEEYRRQHALPHFSDCVICIEHIYDRCLPITAVRDYDNLEFKSILDVIALYCMKDDTGALCDLYHYSLHPAYKHLRECKASAHIPEWQTAVPETPSAIMPSAALIAKTPPKRRGRKPKTVVAADKTSIMTKPENEKELSHGNEQ